LQVTRASPGEAILAGGLEGYRVVMRALAGESDVMDVTATAVGPAHLAGAGSGGEDQGVPVAPPGFRRERQAGGGGPETGPAAGATGRLWTAARRRAMSRVFIGSGHNARIGPGELVGAIVNEAGVEAGQFVDIAIADGHSRVEVPEELAERVVAALRATTIKGRRQTIRRDTANGSAGWKVTH
jgi:ATP-dependent RNA helicase DeaD